MSRTPPSLLTMWFQRKDVIDMECCAYTPLIAFVDGLHYAAITDINSSSQNGYIKLVTYAAARL
ncbi:unnamed protein product [Linum tenue]|uniref:Ubiquitinyl hydrolase 1 n=1 Tax=Linum tenue TaxID=586396 RepID=A0AAV0PPD4_9ROSI|nr:unnamed protein product [Linum tenue]